jgi:hypothetical protein
METAGRRVAYGLSALTMFSCCIGHGMRVASFRGTSPRSSGRAMVGKDGRDSERVTTTLTKAKKQELDALASKYGVTASWLQRRAIENFLEDPQLTLPLAGNGDA